MTCGNPNCIPCQRKLKEKLEPVPPPEPVGPEFYRALLRFTCDDVPLGNFPYTLVLGDGSRIDGTTTDDGLTELVSRERSTSVLNAVLTIPRAGNCCGTQGQTLPGERLYLSEHGNAVASFVRTRDLPPVTNIKVPKGGDRGLTVGEEAMARTVFGDAVNYSIVRINHHGYWQLMGLQDKDTAVTPNGSIYMPHPIYRDDYSDGDDSDRRLFMHEMVHVWQYQLGYPVKMKGLTVTSRGVEAYRYNLTPVSRLSDFNMEQQGNLLADYYMICIYGRAQGAFNPQMPSAWLYQVMEPFVNPKDPAHLPNKNL